MEVEQKYLSLSEASALTPYSSSYLSYLARKGKLRSLKNGDTWFTTRDWVLDYMNFVAERPQNHSPKKQKAKTGKAPAGYVTSAQAERIFPYSSSYFSLRIRQGKLKGEKIGGKWFTTVDWVNEYISEFGEKASSVIASDQRERSNPDSASDMALRESNFQRDVKIAAVASTLPRNDKPFRNFFNFSFLQPMAIGLTVVTVLIFAGPPKFMARWVYSPLALAYQETINTIGSISGKINLDSKGQVAGETIKSEK